MVRDPILIASSKIDEPGYSRVCKEIESQGYPITVYQTDRVLSGEDSFIVEINEDAALTMTYNDESILPQNIGAAWYRKIGSFALPYEETQIGKQLYLNNEIRLFHDMIWTLYPEDIWLNSPDKMLRADRKLGQMLVAHQVGFDVPDTMISSDWSAVKQQFLSSDQDVVIKMLRGVISEGEQIKAMYSIKANLEKMNQLEQTTYAFPAYYRPYIQKAREWRITVVGDDIFPASIYTEEPAKEDWRRHQTVDYVDFRKEAPPEQISEGCVEYLGLMGLKFGCFDFIEQPNGKIIFLECNPNGQYGWLEDELELPISQAIANELITIAKSK